MTDDKWVCNRCGREHAGKPIKNAICNDEGCKGRFQHYHRCRVCNDWFRCAQGRTVCNECTEKGFGRTHGSSVEVVCAQCGKVFRRPKANARGRKQFCSLNCMRENERTRWLDRVCLECGKSFKVLRSTLEKSNTSGHYCSVECYVNAQHIEGSISWKGGFGRVKREHFGGVQFCAICGTHKNIHIHHIIPYRMTQDNSLENLIPLCASHHAIIEHIWLPFIEMFDDPKEAQPYVAASLRARQAQTMKVLKSIINTMHSVE